MGVFEMSASELRSALGTELDIDEKKLKKNFKKVQSRNLLWIWLIAKSAGVSFLGTK